MKEVKKQTCFDVILNQRLGIGLVFERLEVPLKNYWSFITLEIENLDLVSIYPKLPKYSFVCLFVCLLDPTFLCTGFKHIVLHSDYLLQSVEW